ncbi:flagellar biosynthetic protein FliR [Bradyrhizobium diazoefficiens]
MRIDVSLLPALAAAFMLVFARVGAMVMLLPGLGETNIPTRVKLSIALLLTLIILPLHRSAYHVDMGSLAPLLVLMLHEIAIGIVLGATARVTLSALQVAGSVIAQQMGLGFVTSVDPTQGQQGVLVGNFLTMLGVTLLFATDSHHLVIAALNDSYAIFSPGETVSSGDVASLATRAFAAAFRLGLQLSGPFLVFGLVFNIGLGVLARLMAADAGLFRRRAAVDLRRLPGARRGAHGDDGHLSGLFHRCHAPDDAAQVGDRWRKTTIQRVKQKTRRKNASTRRSNAAMSPRARRSTPGS